jgi:hypothetical protein
VDDPVFWRSPWSAEQSIALQARTWDTLVSTSRTWWSFWLAAFPVPNWPAAGVVAPVDKKATETRHPPDRKKPAAPRRSAPAARKRATHATAREGQGSHGH